MPLVFMRRIWFVAALLLAWTMPTRLAASAVDTVVRTRVALLAPSLQDNAPLANSSPNATSCPKTPPICAEAQRAEHRFGRGGGATAPGGWASPATEYERKAWGQLEAKGGARADTPIRLQGQYWDEETGLAYNRYRHSDLDGRFISADPLALTAGTHMFRAALNPFGWVDPYGLATMREAEALLDASEGTPFGGGVGHALVHIPPAGADTGAEHAASRGNANNTVFRNRNQAIRALRDCMTANEQALNNLQPGDTHGGPRMALPQTVGGLQATRGPYATAVRPVEVGSVSYRFARQPNGDLHLIHFQPHAVGT